MKKYWAIYRKQGDEEEFLAEAYSEREAKEYIRDARTEEPDTSISFIAIEYEFKSKYRIFSFYVPTGKELKT